MPNALKPRKPSPPPPDPDPEIDPEQIPEPTPQRVTARAAPSDWTQTPEAIDHAGRILGMARLPFEQDTEYIDRIQARIQLG
jgi:hypothetical protein